MFLSECREFLSAPCFAGKNLMTARVWMLMKTRASLKSFRACFLPGRATDLSAPRYLVNILLTFIDGASLDCFRNFVEFLMAARRSAAIRLLRF